MRIVITLICFVMKRVLLVCAMTLPIVLTGCLPVVLVGGTATGVVMTKDKALGDSLKDSNIETAIKKRLYSNLGPGVYSDVSVVSECGAVLLTGSVRTPDISSSCEEIAWTVDGVTSVDNNLFVGDQIPLSVMMKDNMITSEARSVLIVTKNVKSVNYKLKTMNQVLYVRGIAHSQEELEAALSSLQRIKGVNKVVSYVIVKPAH